MLTHVPLCAFNDFDRLYHWKPEVFEVELGAFGLVTIASEKQESYRFIVL